MLPLPRPLTLLLLWWARWKLMNRMRTKMYRTGIGAGETLICRL